MKIRLIALLLCLVLLLTGCSGNGSKEDISNNGGSDNQTEDNNNTENNETESGTQGEVADLGDDNKTFGEDIDETGAYEGYFEGESKNIEVKCVSGTDKAYKLE